MLESLADIAASQLELRRMRKIFRESRGQNKHAREPRDRDLAAQVRPAAGAGQAAVCPFLPAGSRAIHAQDRRAGSADSLAASRSGIDSADGLHPSGGRERSDFAHRRLGALGGMRPNSKWCREDPENGAPRVCVNLSARQFAREGLADHVEALLRQSGVPSRLLGLEMTESSLISDDGTPQEVLISLRRLGVSLLMDDFGTGYSSLHHLHSLPFDVLKIDRSFVSRMTGGSDQPLQIVRTIVELARVLGMDVVAEGIETLEQYALLRAAGLPIRTGIPVLSSRDGGNHQRDVAAARTRFARAGGGCV